jgi:hypothetical protein
MSSLRNQQSVVADAPRVLVYDNYIMYDRWMTYRRFNSYFKDDDHPYNSEEEEREYYNKNVFNFLVLKFKRRADGTLSDNDLVLFDAKYNNIYILGNCFHDYKTEVVEEQNDFHNREIRSLRIESSSDQALCLHCDENRWCSCNSNDNGYCNEHAEFEHEFDDIDLDRLLTVGELLGIAGFESLTDYPFIFYRSPQNNPDNEENNDDDDDDEYRRYHTFDSDTDFSDNDDDFDDRRHGPEHTIEDLGETEDEEEHEKIESKIESKDEEVDDTCVAHCSLTPQDDLFENIDESELDEKANDIIQQVKDFVHYKNGKSQYRSTFVGLCRKMILLVNQPECDKKDEVYLWFFSLLNTKWGRYYTVLSKNIMKIAYHKALEIKNSLHTAENVDTLCSEVDKFIANALKLNSSLDSL